MVHGWCTLTTSDVIIWMCLVWIRGYGEIGLGCLDKRIQDMEDGVGSGYVVIGYGKIRMVSGAG